MPNPKGSESGSLWGKHDPQYRQRIADVDFGDALHRNELFRRRRIVLEYTSQRLEIMKTLNILPGAAAVIALTVVTGFVGGKREIESGTFSRSRVSLVRDLKQRISEGTLPGDIEAEGPAYLVQVGRGNARKEVLIDAVTGRILS